MTVERDTYTVITAIQTLFAKARESNKRLEKRPDNVETRRLRTSNNQSLGFLARLMKETLDLTKILNQGVSQ